MLWDVGGLDVADIRCPSTADRLSLSCATCGEHLPRPVRWRNAVVWLQVHSTPLCRINAWWNPELAGDVSGRFFPKAGYLSGTRPMLDGKSGAASPVLRHRAAHCGPRRHPGRLSRVRSKTSIMLSMQGMYAKRCAFPNSSSTRIFLLERFLPGILASLLPAWCHLDQGYY